MQYKSNGLCLNIRKAKIDDIDNIMTIEPHAFGNHHWSKQAFINELNNDFSTYLIAELPELQNKLVGYIGYWLVQNEGHITTLAVDASYRKRGIADILLYSLINNAIHNGIKWLTLEVRASNIPAINLYKKYNFKQLGMRKNYYQDNNEDAFILWTEDITNPDFINNAKGKVSHIQRSEEHADKYQYA